VALNDMLLAGDEDYEDYGGDTAPGALCTTPFLGMRTVCCGWSAVKMSPKLVAKFAIMAMVFSSCHLLSSN